LVEEEEHVKECHSNTHHHHFLLASAAPVVKGEEIVATFSFVLNDREENRKEDNSCKIYTVNQIKKNYLNTFTEKSDMTLLARNPQTRQHQTRGPANNCGKIPMLDTPSPKASA
jgi:hypothetical protein